MAPVRRKQSQIPDCHWSDLKKEARIRNFLVLDYEISSEPTSLKFSLRTSTAHRDTVLESKVNKLISLHGRQTRWIPFYVERDQNRPGSVLDPFQIRFGPGTNPVRTRPVFWIGSWTVTKRFYICDTRQMRVPTSIHSHEIHWIISVVLRKKKLENQIAREKQKEILDQDMTSSLRVCTCLIAIILFDYILVQRIVQNEKTKKRILSETVSIYFWK